MVDQYRRLRDAKTGGRPVAAPDTPLDAPVYVLLAHLHAHRIIHRDVKPGNIFLVERPDADGLVMDAKLGDFGISRLLSDETLMAKTAVGTPYYMSPELVAGKGYDGRADVWSLGVIAYELCVLKRPFHAPNVGALAMAITTRAPASLPETVPPDLAAFVNNCLRKDPEERPSAAALLALPTLRAWVAGEASSPYTASHSAMLFGASVPPPALDFSKTARLEV